MKLSDFDYHLPTELIAQIPLAERTSSRLMVLDRNLQKIEDKKFVNLIDYLQPGDLILMNNTRVIPARLFGQVKDYSKKVEVFLLRPLQNSMWECLVKPGKKLREGSSVDFGEGFFGKIKKVNVDGTRQIAFNKVDVLPLLDKFGEMPLPPYIKIKLEDKERYQTVYADRAASVAAPTAGLHFTPSYLEKLQAKGVVFDFINLEVGLGTFLPVKKEDIREHKMHAENYELTEDVVQKIYTTKKNGKRVFAVGTTTLRVLESCLNFEGNLISQKGETDIFIYPPYDFKVVDALLTNFHLPKSTLLMLISAFAGRDFVLEAYQKAINLRYRFFSFGDAMLIV